jgi:hypothetical protein
MYTSKIEITDSETQKRLLSEIGGNEWEKAGKHRVYFNNMYELWGLEVDFYKTGNVRFASIDGAEISNSQARREMAKLDYGKIYFDFSDCRFHSSGSIDDEVADELTYKITKRLGL